jgi:hypothetical protein
MDPDPDPGVPKTCGSGVSGSGFFSDPDADSDPDPQHCLVVGLEVDGEAVTLHEARVAVLAPVRFFTCRKNITYKPVPVSRECIRIPPFKPAKNYPTFDQ